MATASDALEYMIAGASAVQVGTATFIHPTAMLTIIDDLDTWLRARDISSVRDIIGTVADGEEDLASTMMAVAQ